MNTEKIYFEKASIKHQDIIFQWLAVPHMQKFWDNSQEHKDDILNFLHGRKQHYFYGTTQYWVGYIGDQAFCFILSDQLLSSQNLSDVHRENLSKVGHTIGLDFGIGNTAYIGKGLAALTLEAFVAFYYKCIDQKADTFFIDPDKNNPRAIHVYEKAGFKMVGNFIATEGAFKEQTSYLMMKQISSSVQLVKATLADYPTIQNMARFYVYDLSRYCGFISEEWVCPSDGLYADADLKNYFQDADRSGYLIKIDEELAGFALLHYVISDPGYWVMAEFFILAKFQGKGIGGHMAEQLWKMHPGKWEVPTIPENKKALNFWRKIISNFTDGHYKEELKVVDYDKHQPKRYIFSFETKEKDRVPETISVRKAIENDIPRMIKLSNIKRRDYEKAQPLFWRYAEGAEEIQTQWFKELLQKDDSILFVAEFSNEIAGFIIGRLTSAPPVYNPGGLTLLIDDFCVAENRLWNSVGTRLISGIKQYSRDKNAVQILVTCGAHDDSKTQFLKTCGLYVVSEWYVGDIIKK